ncbi:uncharacterized protein G2W53_010723 [Senna tora]|uniref:Uncharacterized protein n=1 Tax=Senna tora TaxID=362788 RepID=A0A834X0T6_9FABA|nr:uncharacterized protein G2W53_010723 [Senna tora]
MDTVEDKALAECLVVMRQEQKYMQGSTFNDGGTPAWLRLIRRQPSIGIVLSHSLRSFVLYGEMIVHMGRMHVQLVTLMKSRTISFMKYWKTFEETVGTMPSMNFTEGPVVNASDMSSGRKKRKRNHKDHLAVALENVGASIESSINSLSSNVDKLEHEYDMTVYDLQYLQGPTKKGVGGLGCNEIELKMMQVEDSLHEYLESCTCNGHFAEDGAK